MHNMAAAGPSRKLFSEARVIRILSKTDIVINKGKIDGVELRDKFSVGENLGSILDPESQKSYGHIISNKDTLEVTSAYLHFSVLSKITRNTNGGLINRSLSNIAAGNIVQNLYGETNVTKETIKVNTEQIQPLRSEKGHLISLGDLAILVNN